jgi:outer membrane scaffolding protein for murein synthesis (MipA/OmpV family)
MWRLAIVAAGTALLLPASGSAQQPTADYTLVGAGLRSRPAYDGAASQRGEAIPVLRYYGERWFARTTQGVLEAGARSRPRDGLAVGAQLAYEGGRLRSESALLDSRGVEDIAPGASIGAHMDWDVQIGPVPVTALARLRRHLRTALGRQADLRLTAGVYRGARFSAAVFVQATWADARSVQAYYGVTAEQAAATGLPGFGASGGLLFTSTGLLWSYDLDPAWVLVGSLESRQLRGDARRSPLAEDASNAYASAGLAYRF